MEKKLRFNEFEIFESAPKFKFKKLDEPIWTDGPQLDIISGRLDPADFLADKAQIKQLNDAVALINYFLDALEDKELIEIG